MIGVMPPKAILGRSLLYVQSQWVANSCTSAMLSKSHCESQSYRTRAAIALDVRDLLGLSRLNEIEVDVALLGPRVHDESDVLRAVVTANAVRLSTPRDELIERAHDPFGRERQIRLDREPFAIEVVDHVEEPKRASIAALIVQEIHRPRLIDRVGHRERLRRGARTSRCWGFMRRLSSSTRWIR